MKYLLLLVLLCLGCSKAPVHDPSDVPIGISAGGTNGTVVYHCEQLQNNPSEVPIVCYFKNTTNHPFELATVRIGWYSEATGEELTHTEWASRPSLRPDHEEKMYFFYPLVDLRLRCGYHFDRCVMLIDRP